MVKIKNQSHINIITILLMGYPQAFYTKQTQKSN